MSRVKAGVITKTRHKKIIKRAKGYYGRRKNTFKAAKNVEKAGQYAYIEKVRKETLEVYGYNELTLVAGSKY